MTATELFGLIVFSLMFFSLGLLGARAAYGARDNKERIVFAAGLFALFGLPALMALRVMGS
jgi:hypothetical protein